MVFTAPTQESRKRKSKREVETPEASHLTIKAVTSNSERDRQQTKFESENFLGKMFTIIAGRGRKHQLHESLLSESPAFEAMFTVDFQEKETGIVELPNDDPVALEVLLEIFIRNCNSGNVMRQICSDHLTDYEDCLLKLAEVCILADKYELPRTRLLIIGFFKYVELHEKVVLTFFTIVDTIHKNVISLEDPFRDYFREAAHIAFRNLHDVAIDKIDDLVKGGDDLAVDICNALASAWCAERERSEACINDLENKRLEWKDEMETLMKRAAYEKVGVEKAAANERYRMEELWKREMYEKEARWKRERDELMGLLATASTNHGEFMARFPTGLYWP